VWQTALGDPDSFIILASVQPPLASHFYIKAKPNLTMAMMTIRGEMKSTGTLTVDTLATPHWIAINTPISPDSTCKII
jgi:hypothetical protein